MPTSISISTPATNGALPGTISGGYDIRTSPPPFPRPPHGVHLSDVGGDPPPPPPPPPPPTPGGGPIIQVVVSSASQNYTSSVIGASLSPARMGDLTNGTWTCDAPSDVPDTTDLIVTATLASVSPTKTATSSGVHKP